MLRSRIRLGDSRAGLEYIPNFDAYLGRRPKNVRVSRKVRKLVYLSAAVLLRGARRDYPTGPV